MDYVRIMKLGLVSLVIAIVFSNSQVFALPTFQTYIDNSVAGNMGADKNTWISNLNPFTLNVIAAYGPNTLNISGVTLLVSVPQGEQGTIGFLTSDESPSLLTGVGSGTLSPNLNPIINADANILSDVSGNDGYIGLNFLPLALNLNSHYPLQDNVSDFIIFGLGSFDHSENNLNNYNADNGAISSTTASGEQKAYSVNYTGFSRVHFDVYGLETEKNGNQEIKTTWDNNPGSHDATSTSNSTPIPEPATLLLLAPALLGAVLTRKGN